MCVHVCIHTYVCVCTYMYMYIYIYIYIICVYAYTCVYLYIRSCILTDTCIHTPSAHRRLLCALDFKHEPMHIDTYTCTTTCMHTDTIHTHIVLVMQPLCRCASAQHTYEHMRRHAGEHHLCICFLYAALRPRCCLLRMCHGLMPLLQYPHFRMRVFAMAGVFGMAGACRLGGGIKEWQKYNGMTPCNGTGNSTEQLLAHTSASKLC
jgi:hypothetical protein